MQNNQVVPVKEFLKFTPTELVDGLGIGHNVLFDDGNVVYMTANEIKISRFLWTVTEGLNFIQYTTEYNIANYYKNGMFTTGSINGVYSVMTRDLADMVMTGDANKVWLEELYERMLLANNMLYNEIVYGKIEYLSSLHINDFLDIQFHPELIGAIKEVSKTKSQAAIKEVYVVMDKVINLPVYANNTVAKGYISGTYSAGQVKQMLASRGYVTELDSSLFKIPIASSFVLGFNSIYELTIESRSGAKALFLSNIAIRDSEYFAREMQLITMVIEHIKMGDCGNTDYLPWLVRGDDAEAGTKSDIPLMLGSKFFNDKTGKEEVITSKHTHLEGTTIKLRTAINCKLQDKNSVCSACFGGLQHAVHRHTNVGHLSSTSTTERISQSILSTKHLVANASSGTLSLSDDAAMFFNIKSKNSYAFKPTVLNRARAKLKLILGQTEAFGINDLTPGADVYKLNPSRVSRLSWITVVVVNPEGKEEHYPIKISEATRTGYLTYEFLDYIVKKGYVLDDKDRYVIDLEDWTTAAPILTLPEVEYNFVALAKAIKGKFKSLKLNKEKRSIETPESLLQTVFDLVNSKLDINISLLSVMVSAFIIYNRDAKDYDLGRNAIDRDLDRISGVLSNRSLGGTLAWEEQAKFILSPKVFYARNAVDHPMDVFIRPSETIKDYYGSVGKPQEGYRDRANLGLIK